MTNKLPKRLIVLREEQGYRSAREASKAMGIQYQTYWAYEAGTRMPAIDVLIKIAQFYNVTIDYLLGISSKKGEERGKIVPVTEIKERWPELSDKLDEIEAEFIRWDVGTMEYEDILQFVHDALQHKSKK